MMGSGKSTVGKILADRLKMNFIDLDAMIEHEYGTIAAIFNTNGEDYFRKLETEFLGLVSGRSNTVVSTGGGIPCSGTNVEIMRASGKVIYLQCDVDELMSRLEQERSNRPLLATGELRTKLETLLRQRGACYASADYTVNANQSPGNVVLSILRVLD